MKLTLGTAQLGFNYGIANNIGMPSEEEALKILKSAYTAGIRTFDTAATYGESEKIIGKFIASNNLQGKLNIISKGRLSPKCDDLLRTLKNLNLKYIDYYLLHNPSDLYDYDNQLKPYIDKEVVKKFGVSVYNSEQIRQCFKIDAIKVIQIPFNMLDNRLIKDGLLQEMKNRGIEIHARSIYLQGLLLMDKNDVPQNLSEVTEYLDSFDQMAKNCGITRKELLFLYVKNNKYIDKMIVGCESASQLHQNMVIYNKKIKVDTDAKFMFVPEKILNPSMWE